MGRPRNHNGLMRIEKVGTELVLQRDNKAGKNYSNGRGRKLIRMSDEALGSCTEELLKQAQDAEAYKRARIRELYVEFGYVSNSVAAMIGVACTQYCLGNSLLSEYAKNPSPRVALAASKVFDSAKNSEAQAWEMCKLEANAQKARQINAPAPWERDPGRPPSMGSPSMVESIEEGEIISPLDVKKLKEKAMNSIQNGRDRL